MSAHRVRVGPLPAWLDARRLLGPTFRWDADTRHAEAELSRDDAAFLLARLRHLGFDGEPVVVDVRPPLKRPAVRDGRTRLARALRDTTPGFLRPGARLDDEGRYSLTPEALAMRLARPWAGRAVVDATCGCGGNTIAFARHGCAVTAIERDADRLALARHNAAVYGVEDRVTWLHGDALALAPTLTADLLFVDPPWGTDWDPTRTTLDDLPLLTALLPLAARFGALLAKVPSSFDTRTLPGAAVRAWFGEAPGDRARVKFLTVLARGPALSPGGDDAGAPPA